MIWRLLRTKHIEIQNIHRIYGLILMEHLCYLLLYTKKIKLLSDGNIFAFEYVCDYLLASDPLFIQPYIERYAEGHFTEMEKEWMEKNFYKSEYVVNIAKSFV